MVQMQPYLAAACALGVASLAPAFAESTPAAVPNDKPTARSIGVVLELPDADGITLDLELRDQNFDGEEWTGTLVFEGVFTDDGGSETPMTYTVDAASLAKAIDSWVWVDLEEDVLAVRAGESIVAMSSVATNGGKTVMSHVASTQFLGTSDGSARVDVTGNFEDLQSVIPTETFVAEPDQFAAALASSLASLTGSFGPSPINSGSTLAECATLARDTCSTRCPDGKIRRCIDTFDWGPDGSCSFDCFTQVECCPSYNDDPDL